MKPNKMSNEQLACNLEAMIAFLTTAARHQTDADEIMREAAARLRALSALTTHEDKREVAELERRYADACRCCDDAERRLKVAEDALTELQTRCVASVHDGTIDPYEALKIAEDALAAIREPVTDCNQPKGGDPCNARDGEGSSLRIGWEGEKEYCVVAKYRHDLQVELEDYDYHRVTGPLPLDIAKHWLEYHERIRTKSEDPKILVRDVSKWRVFDKVEEGDAK